MSHQGTGVQLSLTGLTQYYDASHLSIAGIQLGSASSILLAVWHTADETEVACFMPWTL